MTSPAVLERGTSVWTIDPTHTQVEFGVRHLMISTVRGHFADVQGDVTLDGEDVETAQVDITIDAASIDTRVEQRDEHLRSPDFLDVAEFPELRFHSTKVERVGKDKLEITGDLTIRDVTREVVLEARELGTVHDPWGNDRAGFSAKAEINRPDFGLTWNQVLETGGLLVGERVSITIETELVLKAE
jgi:polyisoprenoid-binding protein YceI